MRWNQSGVCSGGRGKLSRVISVKSGTRPGAPAASSHYFRGGGGGSAAIHLHHICISATFSRRANTRSTFVVNKWQSRWRFYYLYQHLFIPNGRQISLSRVHALGLNTPASQPGGAAESEHSCTGLCSDSCSMIYNTRVALSLQIHSFIHHQ